MEENIGNITYPKTYTRLMANIFDSFPISILALVLLTLLSFSSIEIFNLDNITGIFSWDPNTLIEGEAVYDPVKDFFSFLAAMTVLYMFVGFSYFQVMLDSKKQATFGMQIFSLRLVNLDGSRPTTNAVFTRNILFYILKTLYIGGISILTIEIHKYHQALHDMPTGTTMVQVK